MGEVTLRYGIIGTWMMATSTSAAWRCFPGPQCFLPEITELLTR